MNIDIKFLIKPLFLLAFTYLVTSCGSQKNVTTEKVQYVDSLSDEDKFEFKYQFFEANKNFLTGNHELALSLFSSCLTIDPNSAVVNYKIASIYLAKSDFEMAQVHAEKSIMLNPRNIWYLYLAGSLYTQNNNFDKAKTTFERLIEINEGELDFYLNLADVYLKENNVEGALKVYKRVENRFGISEIISLQKHKLFLASNKQKEALNELIKLLDANPSNIEYKRLIADYYIKIDNINNAIETYNEILSVFPNDGYSRIGLAECYRKNKEINKSFEQLKLAFGSEDLPSDVKFNMLISLIQNTGANGEMQKAIYELTEILHNKYPEDADIATIYANFLLQHNKLEDAKQILIEVVKIRKDKYAVWEQLILLDNEFVNWDDMFMHTNEALKYFPNQSFLYFFNGFSAFQLERFDDAVKSLSFGYKLITVDDPLRSDFQTFLGEAYFKIGDKKKAYGYFDDIIKDQPDNIMVLNNYAYYLSEDGEDLDKAKSMSKLTIEKEPENATYLDTYAWILFKLNNYSEALIYIEKAIEYDTNVSDVVLEHYGDILFHNSLVDEAIVQWLKAKAKGEGSGLLDKKIDSKKYIE